jgi:hypothetical protein
MHLSRIDVHMAAYDAFEAALAARTIEAAIEPIRHVLEVLDREDLLRVAMALAVEATLRLTPPAERGRLLDRVQRARLETMLAGS